MEQNDKESRKKLKKTTETLPPEGSQIEYGEKETSQLIYVKHTQKESPKLSVFIIIVYLCYN